MPSRTALEAGVLPVHRLPGTLAVRAGARYARPHPQRIALIQMWDGTILLPLTRDARDARGHFDAAFVCFCCQSPTRSQWRIIRKIRSLHPRAQAHPLNRLHG